MYISMFVKLLSVVIFSFAGVLNTLQLQDKAFRHLERY